MVRIVKRVSLAMLLLITELVHVYPVQLDTETQETHQFVLLAQQDILRALVKLVHLVYRVTYLLREVLVCRALLVMVILITLMLLRFVLHVLVDQVQMMEVNASDVKKEKFLRVEDYVYRVTLDTNPMKAKLPA